MTAIFELPLPSETLNSDEIVLLAEFWESGLREKGFHGVLDCLDGTVFLNKVTWNDRRRR